ncbi:hypothetical protein KC19_7G191100 [Ceratodon purpureus]|uniref:GDT1 family protein n=1 Tax=Ceratodon purpureus TaxID=3225 RepID=A0A8T0HCJ7_CERPU|nr:hypothetical protein KC19_7G191100 [Ceratodon purpureus]
MAMALPGSHLLSSRSFLPHGFCVPQRSRSLPRSLRPHCPSVGPVFPTVRRLSVQKFRISASSSVGPYDGSQGNQDNATDNTALDQPKEKRKATLQAIAGVTALVGLGTLGGVALTLSQGGPAALMAAIAKSGFSAAFALIFVSEIGDKTFFIAALLAMRHSRFLVLLGATGALSLMTVISVVIGRIFQSVPAQLQTTLPIGEYAAVALLIWFGFRSIKAAWDLPSDQTGTSKDSSDSGELAEAQEFLEKSETKKVATPLEVVTEAFSLVFVAEWGDRSMLATVALGAAQSPWGVASGAIAGHVIATALAVLGGAFLAQYISEKVIGYTGGVLFLVFAAATLLGVF